MRSAEFRRAVVLLSGGLDSAANLAFAAREGRVALALTANYGQRASEAEARASRALCMHYGVKHVEVDLTWLGALGGSALTDLSRSVPQVAATELDAIDKARQSAAAVWVPNRNGVLIAMASAYAERIGADAVLVGFNREEAMTFPDNSSEYMQAMTAALRYSTQNGVEVASYTDRLDKREIVARLRAIAFPFERVWSCYAGGDHPCGECESCKRFRRAMMGFDGGEARL